MELAKRFEGLRDLRSDGLVYPYLDPVALPTIGFGRLLSREKHADLSRWVPITLETAEEYLMVDLAKAAAAVDRLCPVPLSDLQRAALIDFAFNCGAGNLQVSALRQKVLRGEHDEVPAQLGRWVFAAGVKYRGLVLRRKAEAALYIAGS